MNENEKIPVLNDGDQIKIEITNPTVDALLSKVLPHQVELNRAWLYDEDEDDAVGETNFVVSEEFARKIFDEKYSEKYSDFEEFLDVYEPEEDGEYIYQRAIADGELIEDIGEVLYDAMADDEDMSEEATGRYMLITTRSGFYSEHSEEYGTLSELRKKIRKMYDDSMSPSDDDDDAVINGHWKDSWSEEIIKEDEITISYLNGMECVTRYAFIVKID